MHITQSDLENAPRIKRLNIVNSISGIKPANLVGTVSSEGISNLAIFSSVFHLGSNPALLGMISRPSGEVRRHSLENILSKGYFTLNHVSKDHIKKAHYTSAKFTEEVSEFEACQFTEEYKDGFHAPYVQQSKIQLGMRFVKKIPIDINDTLLIIASIEHIYLPEECIDKEGHLNLEIAGSTGISGLNSYYSLVKKDQFPYARPEELPNFD